MRFGGYATNKGSKLNTENDFYTFLITSHINAKHSILDKDLRFQQTLETINSVRLKVANAKILFCDNSIIPLSQEQYEVITSLVDKFIPYQNNLFTRYVSNDGYNTGLNEMLVIEEMFRVMKDDNLIGKRIFKLSGRYKLHDKFDISEYEKPEYLGKYVGRITTWWFNEGAFYKDDFSTVLYSMCSSLFDDYVDLLDKVFETMLRTPDSMEHAHNVCFPKDKLLILPHVHVCGNISKTNEYIEF